MKKSRTPSILMLAFAVTTMLSCTIFVGGPVYTGSQIPVSTAAVGELQTAVASAAAAGALSGQLSLVITEEQLTSLLAMKLQEQASPFITEPQVTLREGQIKIYGTARQGYFTATISIVLTAGISETGGLYIDVTSIDFGPLPVPQGLRDALSATLEEATTGAIGPAATGFRLESITIADGRMTITGRTR